MKGWLYVISNEAVKGMVKVGAAPKDPVAYAESLDKAGLPFPYELGYEALVPDMEQAENTVRSALSPRAAGNGWYFFSVAEAVREIITSAGGSILMENRYDGQSRADKIREETSSPDPTRRASILSDSSCPINVLQFALEREEDEFVLLAVLANPACLRLVDGLIDLVERVSDQETVLMAIATNPKMDPDVLEAVFDATSSAEKVVLALFMNPSFPASCFVDAVDIYFEDEKLIRKVLERTDCDPDALASIVWFCDGEGELNDAAKCHPNWSLEHIHDLLWLKADDYDLLEIVAGHPDCPPLLLSQLWWGETGLSKEIILSNPGCPESILVSATLNGEGDENPDSYAWKLARAAESNPANPLSKAAGSDVKAAELESLACSTFPEVVARVAGNEACPHSLLRRLSESITRTIRCAVAANPCCPSDVIGKLVNDGDPGVRSAALRNPGCPLDVLQKYSDHELYEWRLVVLENSSCPRSVVEKLAKDRSHEVRTVAKSRLFEPKKGLKLKPGPARDETADAIRERFRNHVRKTLGALIEESELLRLSALPAGEREGFAKKFPGQAKQLAIFEKYLLPKIREESVG